MRAIRPAATLEPTASTVGCSVAIVTTKPVAASDIRTQLMRPFGRGEKCMSTQLIPADAPGYANLMMIPFSQDDIQLSKDGKSLIWAPKFDLEHCGLEWKDASGNAYPFALKSAGGARFPFLTPDDLAAEMIADEVIGRKNIEKRNAGKKEVLTASQKRRNRRKLAQKKWAEASKPSNGLSNIVFSELLDDARKEYVEENSQQRVERKAKQLAKRYEENRLSVAECESLLVGLNLMLATLPEGTDAWLAVKAQHEQYTAKLEAAQSGKRDAAKAVTNNVEAATASDVGKDIAGAALIADTDLADVMAAE